MEYNLDWCCSFVCCCFHVTFALVFVWYVKVQVSIYLIRNLLVNYDP